MGGRTGVGKVNVKHFNFLPLFLFPPSHDAVCVANTHTQKKLFSRLLTHTHFSARDVTFFFVSQDANFVAEPFSVLPAFVFFLLSLSLPSRLVFFLLCLPKIMRKNYAVKSRRRRRHRETGIGSAGAHAMHSHTQQRKKKRNFPLVKTGWLCKTFPHTFFSCNAKFPKPMVATKLLDRGKI